MVGKDFEISAYYIRRLLSVTDQRDDGIGEKKVVSVEEVDIFPGSVAHSGVSGCGQPFVYRVRYYLDLFFPIGVRYYIMRFRYTIVRRSVVN
jgi:hypothetical protein